MSHADIGLYTNTWAVFRILYFTTAWHLSYVLPASNLHTILLCWRKVTLVRARTKAVAHCICLPKGCPPLPLWIRGDALKVEHESHRIFSSLYKSTNLVYDACHAAFQTLPCIWVTHAAVCLASRLRMPFSCVFMVQVFDSRTFEQKKVFKSDRPINGAAISPIAPLVLIGTHISWEEVLYGRGLISWYLKSFLSSNTSARLCCCCFQSICETAA